MKKTIITFTLLGIVIASNGQVTDAESDLKKRKVDTTEGWDKGGTITLNLTQTSLTNWAAGGQNSVSATGLVNLFATYKKGTGLWENYLDLAYGSLKQEGNDNWWKTDDKIDFTSKYGQKAFSDWYYAALLNFRTQMAPGYDYPNDSSKISDLLAPAYTLIAIGLDYKPSKKFTAFIAPLTAKITIVGDQTLANAGAFGVEEAVLDDSGVVITAGKNVRTEVGGYVRLFFKDDLMENVNLQTKLDLFSNYLENPGNIDVNWEVLISMKVNEFISATLSTQLLYDDDIDIAVDTDEDGTPDKSGPRTQFKQVLGIGFSYKF